MSQLAVPRDLTTTGAGGSPRSVGESHGGDADSARGVTVAIDNLSATLAFGSKKEILHDVSLAAVPGEMMALLGPSGSGKTTLLNVISGRTSSRTFHVAGKIYFGGHSVEDAAAKDVNSFTAYVMQEDYMLEYLTVNETLKYAARLQLPLDSRDEQVTKVDKLIAQLGLEQCRDVLVGGRLVKGISGGQRKRVSIAIALLTEPRVLFLDEPTSGLDAALSFDVIRTLQKLTRSTGITIICTIHQPRSQVFVLFDKLVLLRAGRVVYNGPTLEANSYFASLGKICPAGFNPADFYLDLITTEGSGTEEIPDSPARTENDEAPGEDKPREDDKATVSGYAGLKHTSAHQSTAGINRAGSAMRVVATETEADNLIEQYDSSPVKDRVLQQVAVETSGEHAVEPSHLQRETGKSSWFVATWVLFLRSFCQARRQPQFLYVNFASNLFLGIVVGTIWLRITKPENVNADPIVCDTAVARDMLGGVMQLVGTTSFACFDAATYTVNRRPLINRESAGGLYNRSAAFVANFMSDGVLHYWPNMLLAIMLYLMLGLKNDSNAIACWFCFAWLLKFTFWGYSAMCGALAPSIQAAGAILPIGAVLLFLTSGFQLSDAEIPAWLSWIKAISPPRYAFQSIARTQLSDAYVEECFTFQTPKGWGESFGVTLGVALAARLFAALAFQYMHKQEGLQ